MRKIIIKILLKLKLIRRNGFPLRKGKKTNFVFIHINKTAGTSINDNIKMYAKPHYTVKEVQEKIGPDWFHAFTFTVVRNPYDRVVSQYVYRKNIISKILEQIIFHLTNGLSLLTKKKDLNLERIAANFFLHKKNGS